MKYLFLLLALPCFGQVVTRTVCGPGGPISQNTGISAGEQVNAQSGTSYTYQNTDCGKLVKHSNSMAIAASLPHANATTFRAGWFMDVSNAGVGTVTITPVTSTIDGLATLALLTSEGVRIVSNGTNYFTIRGKVTSGGGGGTVTNVGTTAPITGGPITTTGTIACATCVVGPGSATSGHIATFNGTTGVLIQDGGAPATGTVTSVATTSPLGGGAITSTGTLTCSTCVTGGSLTSGQLIQGNTGQAIAVGDLSGDVTTSGSLATTVVKVNGIAYSATAAAHTVQVTTTANTTVTAKAVPDCQDTGGNHLNFTQSSDAFSCGSSGGGGGNTISQGACASLPGSSGSSGNMYKANDDPYMFISDGSNWKAYYLSSFAVTVPPAIGSLTWFNQGGSTYTTATNCSSNLTIAAGATNFRGLYLTPPGTPYTYIITFSPTTQVYQNSQTFGIFGTDGTSVRSCESLFQSGLNVSTRMNHYTATVDSGAVATIAGLFDPAPANYTLRYTDNGTTVTCSVSGDGGRTWVQAASETRTTFVTATSIGFGGGNFSGATIGITVWGFTH